MNSTENHFDKKTPRYKTFNLLIFFFLRNPKPNVNLNVNMTNKTLRKVKRFGKVKGDDCQTLNAK